MSTPTEHLRNRKNDARPELSFLLFGSQAITGGALGAYCVATSVVFLIPNFYNFALIFYLPYIIAAGLTLGLIIGLPIWLFSWSGKVLLTILQRVGICVAVVVVPIVLLPLAVGGDNWIDWIAWARYVLPHAIFQGLLMGMLVGSTVNPLKIVGYGIVAQRGEGHRARNQTPEPLNDLLLFGSLLRMAALGGLLLALFVLACVWPWALQGDTARVGFAATIVYLLGTSYISFSCHRRAVVLTAGILLNILAVATLAEFFDSSGYGSMALAVICFAFQLLWLVFLVSYRSPQSELKKTLAYRTGTHMCLGERFADWELKANS